MFEILRDRCGLGPILPVLAGVSGGPDSLTLLHVLREAAIPVIVAHFNHGLRPEAAHEAAAVESLARQMALPYTSASADVRSYAVQEGLSIEEAARTLRYRFLFEQARERHAQAVAVGHTADDQVETVLMHFLRGAGLAGLKGMTYRTRLPVFDAEIPLVRPLLGMWRTETEAYCRDHGLAPHFDESNADPAFFRNRLRHELIPELQHYNPQVKRAFWRTAFALQGDFDLLAGVLDDAWARSVCEQGEGWVSFDRATLAGFAPALRRNLLRRAAFTLRPGLRDMDYEVLERAAALQACELPGGLRLSVEGQRLYLANWEADLPSAHWPQVKAAASCEIGGSVDLGDGWIFSAEAVDGPQLLDEAMEDADPYHAWMDWEQLQAATPDGRVSFTLRAGSAGERFQPLGLDGHSIKLSDFFVNVKLPQRARKLWPLVYVADVPAWIVGLRLSQRFRVQAETRRAVHLTVGPGN